MLPKCQCSEYSNAGVHHIDLPKMFDFHLRKQINIVHIFSKYKLHIYSCSYLYTSCSNDPTFCIMIRTIFTFLRAKWPATSKYMEEKKIVQNIFFFVKWQCIGKILVLNLEQVYFTSEISLWQPKQIGFVS